MATLTGHVSHEEMAAERAARRVKGVHAIAEGIEVRCLGETSDEEIAQTCAQHSQVVRNGPARRRSSDRAKGTGDSDGRRDLAISAERLEDAVRKLSGVTGVTNSISIKSTANVSDIKKNIEDALTRHAQAIRVTFGRRTRYRLKAESVVGTNAKPSKSLPGRLPACSGSTTA